MSQFMISSTAAPPPPAVPTSFVTDSGTAVPVANILNVLGGNGVSTAGAGNTLTVSPNNVVSGTGTTIGATTADLITFSMGSVPAKYKFKIDIDGFEPTTPAGIGYYVIADIRTTGSVGVIVNSVDGIVENEEAALVATDWDVVLVGNNAVIRVLGAAGLTVRWKATLTYTSVT